MAITMNSPGVVTQEINFSQYVSSVSATSVAMIGTATKGEFNEPVLITTQRAFADTFGNPIGDGDKGQISAMTYLAMGSNVFYTRAGDPTLAKAAHTLVYNYLYTEAIEKGTDAEKIGLTVTDVSDDKKKATITIYYGNKAKDSFEVSLNEDDENFIENMENNYVTFKVLEGASSDMLQIALARLGNSGTKEIYFNYSSDYTSVEECEAAALNTINMIIDNPLVTAEVTVNPITQQTITEARDAIVLALNTLADDPDVPADQKPVDWNNMVEVSDKLYKAAYRAITNHEIVVRWVSPLVLTPATSSAAGMIEGDFEVVHGEYSLPIHYSKLLDKENDYTPVTIDTVFEDVIDVMGDGPQGASDTLYFIPSNKTTQQDIEALVDQFISQDLSISRSWTQPFNKIEATVGPNTDGLITGELTLTKGSTTKKANISLTIPASPISRSLSDTAAAISTTLDRVIDAGNQFISQPIIAAYINSECVDSTIDPTTLTISVTPATASTTGNVTVTGTLSDGSSSETINYSHVLPTMAKASFAQVVDAAEVAIAGINLFNFIDGEGNTVSPIAVDVIGIVNEAIKAIDPEASASWKDGGMAFTEVSSQISGYTGFVTVSSGSDSADVDFNKFTLDTSKEWTAEELAGSSFSVAKVENAGAKIKLTNSYTGASVTCNAILKMLDFEDPMPSYPTISTTDAYVFTEFTDVQYLSGGDNGVTAEIYKKVIGNSVDGTGLCAYYNGNDYYANIICAPGRYEAAVWTKLIDIAETRQDTFALLDTPIGLTRDEVIKWHNGKFGDKLGKDIAPKKAIESSYAGIFWPWQKIYNEFTESYEWIPPCGLVAGIMAQTDRNYHVWFAPAGLKRGLLKLSLETEVNLGKEDTDLLYGNGNVINPIVNYKGKGIVIWGQRTATREASAVDRINVRRMMMQVRKTVEESTAYFVFDPNDETTWRSWKNQISPYLDTIVVGRGFREYKIVMDETTVTDEARDRNEMPGIVYIKPTKTAEFIPIDFVLVAQSATL